MHDFGTQENFDQGRAAALVFDCSKKNIKCALTITWMLCCAFGYKCRW